MLVPVHELLEGEAVAALCTPYEPRVRIRPDEVSHLARLPPRRHGLERLYARPGPGVREPRPRGRRVQPGSRAGELRPGRRAGRAARSRRRATSVFVLDRYEGVEARYLRDLSWDDGATSSSALPNNLTGTSHRTRTGALVGTPLYMSPEQCLGARDVGPPGDIYALSVIAYELFCGRPPFEAEAVGALINMHVNKPVLSPRKLTPGCRGRSRRCCCAGCRRRPRTGTPTWRSCTPTC